IAARKGMNSSQFIRMVMAMPIYSEIETYYTERNMGIREIFDHVGLALRERRMLGKAA
ncbi:MAG: hypothetical protein HQL50_06960, partial [Magnetococcales bacterium]|nr:hypothetical protein [Magnetococcales bacterium]